MPDIVGKRAWYFLFSALLILPGLISLIIPSGWVTGDSGLKAGIDFSSGSVLSVTFEAPVTEDQIRERMNELGHSEALIQRLGGSGFLIRTDLLEQAAGDAPSEREVIERDLEKFLLLDRSRVEFASVSPIVASETVRNAFLAVAAASVFILLFVWFAFRRVPKAYRYGVSAILALVHDVIFVLGVFSILGKVLGMEINAMFIVGILIVAGYSVNDTIVVFDRIRENIGLKTSTDMSVVFNAAINSTLNRTVITSLTKLTGVVIRLLFGGAILRGFSFALLIGVLVGTYSSIFIATPIVLDLGKKQKKLETVSDKKLRHKPEVTPAHV